MTHPRDDLRPIRRPPEPSGRLVALGVALVLLVGTTLFGAARGSDHMLIDDLLAWYDTDAIDECALFMLTFAGFLVAGLFVVWLRNRYTECRHGRHRATFAVQKRIEDRASIVGPVLAASAWRRRFTPCPHCRSP